MGKIGINIYLDILIPICYLISRECHIKSLLAELNAPIRIYTKFNAGRAVLVTGFFCT